MAREIVPMSQLHAEARLPEAGRLRIGEKVTRNGKTYPSKLATWRVTSHDRDAIERVAELYGGTARAWTDSPRSGEWEVITTSNKLRIVLPPDPLGDTPEYQLWSGGGCLRRCDGVVCMSPQATADGAEMVEQPCLCVAAGALLCKPKTRLLVVLRDVPFAGAWRLETNGWYAARELPGMVRMVQTLQGAGLVKAVLVLKEHKDIVAGKTRRWMVPALAVEESVDEIAAGAATLGALAPAAVQAIAAGPDVGEAPSDPAVPDWLDDEIADAELVDEADVPPSEDDASAVTASRDHTGTEGAGPAVDVPPVPLADDWHERTLKRMHALVRDVRAQCDASVDADVWRHGIVKTATKGAKESSADLTDEELRTVVELLEEIKAGRRRYLGLSMGKIRLSAKAES